MKLGETIDALADKLALMGVRLTKITVANEEQQEVVASRLWADAGCPPRDGGTPTIFSYNGVFIDHA